MSFITKFNAVSAIEYKRCAELTVNKQYPIVNMVNVDTRYAVSYTHLDVYKRQIYILRWVVIIKTVIHA